MQRWYNVAREIMAADAVARQKKIIFGKRVVNGVPTTCDIEADETVIKSFTEVVDGELPVHYYLVVLGVVERSNPNTLWLRFLPLKSSIGEGRVGPLEHQVWRDVMDEIFSEDTWAILCTDSGSAYFQKHAGVCEHHAVNHSEHEWARSTTFLESPQTGKRRSAMAGTQFLDHEWRLLKDPLPDSLSARTEAGRASIMNHVRTAQWWRLLSTAGRWPAFCEAACEWRRLHHERGAAASALQGPLVLAHESAPLPAEAAKVSGPTREQDLAAESQARLLVAASDFSASPAASAKPPPPVFFNPPALRGTQTRLANWGLAKFAGPCPMGPGV